MLFIVVWNITLTCGLDGGVARTCHKRHRRINSSNVWLLLIDSILKRKWNKNTKNSMKMYIRSSFNLENWLILRYFLILNTINLFSKDRKTGECTHSS